MSFSRRRLLAAGGAATLAGLLPRHLRAENAVPTVTDRYFVFAYFFGGWDVMMSLDPKDPDLFNTERFSETGILPAYDQLGFDNPFVETGVEGMVFGPYIGELARHADKMAVIRGMAMDSVAHGTGQRHANTGRLPAGNAVRASSMGTTLAALLGNGEPIPNLAADVPSFNIDQPLWASAIGASGADDLADALSPGEIDLPAAERDALERFFAEQRQATQSSWKRVALDNRSISRNLIEKEIGELFNIEQDSAEMAQLRERFGVDSGVTGRGGPLALVAGQALTKGVSRCVSFRATRNIDAHAGDNWRDQHGPDQRAGFNAVAALIDLLSETPFGDGSSWMDHTTIVLQSEFCRTPGLNGQGGRDHHITNSCVLIGGGIRGGQVIGATSDFKLGAQAVDLQTGQLQTNGTFLHNDNIARTLFHSVGVTEDITDLRKDPLLAALA